MPKKNKGKGVLNNILTNPIKATYDFFSPRLDGYNNISLETLKKYGNLEIKELQIVRSPIPVILDKIINIISLGKWNQLKEEYKQNTLFHLALLVDVGNGIKFLVEKNETVDIGTQLEPNKKYEFLKVHPLKKLTTFEMCERVREKIGNEKFFEYDAYNNNCQVFVKLLLENSDMYYPNCAKFTFQDLSGIFDNLPEYVPTTMRLITDIGAISSKVMGKGEKNKLTKKQKDDIKKSFDKYFQKKKDKIKSQDDLYKCFNMWARTKEGKNLIEMSKKN